jgi:hypothetical protein
MSSQRGNVNRSRPQKHTNQIAFKNNKHGDTPRTKLLNNIQVNLTSKYIGLARIITFVFLDMQRMCSLPRCPRVENKV